MKKSSPTILSKNEEIDEKYTVHFFIKKNSYAETYRAKDKDKKTVFLKFYHLSKLHRNQFDNEGNIKEIEILKAIKHPNIVKFIDSGEWFKDNQRFAYLVFEFISGETIEERLKRQHTLNSFEIKQIVSGILNGLKYLHNQKQPFILNNINPQSVMLDLRGHTPIPKIIDFEYARCLYDSKKIFNKEKQNPFYLAPEYFNNIFSPQSDLFSVGALIYHLLTGLPPWFLDLSEYKKSRTNLEEALLNERQKPLKVPSTFNSSLSNQDRKQLFAIAMKALDQDVDKRFKSAEEMLSAIDENEEIKRKFNKSNSTINAFAKQKKEKGNGFSDIAGMNELKDTLYNDVIRALEEKELYEEYGLTIPNGILLYGPPGCGKSFFAQKIAEEIGYNYIEVKPSELASIYVHGSQEKIGHLFDEARINAPTILNFEEFDALVPNRESHSGRNQSGEVNEFLVQLNNCGKDGIFVIASTNRPNLIDPAVLRAGRIDKIFYVGPPDFKARKEMFKILLRKRPLDFGIDYDLLAEKTENYVSIDIEHLINEASRRALKNKSKITQKILHDIIAITKPSVKLSEIKKYEQIRAQFEGIEQQQHRPIGFKITNKN